MKRYLLTLLLIPFFIGCSKDDDESLDITFHKSELQNTNMLCGYYINEDYSLCVSNILLLDYDKKETKYSTSDSRCPNRSGHKKVSNIYLVMSTPDFFKCEECNARFNPFTGNPINEAGKGYRLRVYHTSYDEGNMTYRVWK